MNLRLIDWIWRIRGSVPLAPGITGPATFDRLDSLFHERGTTYDRADDRLTFEKKSPGAQDKMSLFERGTLRVQTGKEGARLHFNLYSHTLLLCFLAPLLFLGFAKFFEATLRHDKAAHSAGIEQVDHGRKAAQDPATKKPKVVVMNPIDKFLGAPPPPEKKPGDEKPSRRRNISPTTAYVFAGIFAFLYIVGRILEQVLIRRVFMKRIGDAVDLRPILFGRVARRYERHHP